MRRLIVLLLIAFSAPLFAQERTLPAYENIYVNDYAALIDADTEARITQTLQDLRTNTGVELTVLTINTQSDYSDLPTIERFARAVFNEWGIGNADRNDGILVLVARDDREMRIQLGAGYDPVYDGRMLRVIDTVFLPAFRNDAYSRGIADGVDAIIERLNPDFRPAEPESRSIFDRIRNSAVLVLFGLYFLFAVLRKKLSDSSVRLRRCPNCGARSLSRSRATMSPSTTSTSGLERLTTRCSNCGYSKDEDRTLPRKSSNRSGGGGGSFGGGRSSGGGASGRW